jgi:putative Mg2+ transporter-C (MgtC) family protein
MMTETGWAAVALRLLIALLLGGAIGVEREIHGKSAGLRTHMLVSLGSALFTVLSYTLAESMGDAARADPTRIAAQIITGVGFLGAGTILQGRGSVHGLTTAASIWLVAAIGMASGAGFYDQALVGTVLGVVVLVAVSQFEQAMIRRGGIRHSVSAVLLGEASPSSIHHLLGEMKVKVARWHYERDKGGLSVRIEARLRPKDLEDLLQALQSRYQIGELKVDQG